jgi:hypothetical protein
MPSDEHRWLNGLTVVLGAYYVFLGADALGAAGALGILGGLAIWAAIADARGPARPAVSRPARCRPTHRSTATPARDPGSIAGAAGPVWACTL